MFDVDVPAQPLSSVSGVRAQHPPPLALPPAQPLWEDAPVLRAPPSADRVSVPAREDSPSLVSERADATALKQEQQNQLALVHEQAAQVCVGNRFRRFSGPVDNRVDS